jgi:hypothetical protein
VIILATGVYRTSAQGLASATVLLLGDPLFAGQYCMGINHIRVRPYGTVRLAKAYPAGISASDRDKGRLYFILPPIKIRFPRIAELLREGSVAKNTTVCVLGL